MAESPKPPQPAPPLVFISYSRNDEEWNERLRNFLRPAVAEGLIELWNNPALNEAVTVLLLSPDYLSEIGSAAPTFSGKLSVFPILIRACAWAEIDWLRKRQIFPSDARPLESRSPAEQDELLAKAAEQIVALASAQVSAAPLLSTIAVQDEPGIAVDIPGTQQSQAATTSLSTDELTVNALSEFPLSNEARNILGRAQVLATFGDTDKPKVTSTCLLFGISEGGRDQRETFITPQFFWRELQRADSEAYQRIFHERFPKAKYSSSDGLVAFDQFDRLADVISDNVLKLFQRAQEISSATLKSVHPSPAEDSVRRDRATQQSDGRVHARHLLAALLVLEETKAMERLSKIVDVALLRGQFLEFIEKSAPDDNFKAWQEIVGTPVSATDEAETTTQTETVKDFRAPLAGFSADFWDGEDLLDITGDVNALASLVAARSIDPPLSIGLFGDWGSGKTHFMRQMKARVKKLSQKARDSGKPQSELGYHKKIVQIEFNAWHYIEGNLWASLVEHIFDNLRITGEKDDVGDTRLKIMEQLGLKQELQKKVEQRQEELKTKAEAAKGRAEEAKNKRADTSQNLLNLRDAPAPGVINRLTTVEVSPEQKVLLKQLGIPEGAQHLPSEIHKRYEDAQTLRGKIRGQWNVFRADPKRINTLIRVLLFLGIAVAIGALFRRTFQTVWGYLVPVLAFPAAAWKAAKPYLERFRKGMDALKQKYDQIEQERQRQIVALESEVNSLTREMTEAENEAKAINKEVRTLETQLNSTTASKLLAGFIEDRAACEDYRRHLGVLALIRRDFEKLSNLLSEQRRDEREHGESTQGEKAVSRIILYIDDLDRCPPDRVVQVLQAIHLLLAFPLFVVVVGVDARWVTRSLRESYDWLGLDEDHQEPHEDKKELVESRVVTPHDYLEKIFQIPFWLRPMEDTDCKKLLEGLTKASRVESPGSENGANQASKKESREIREVASPGSQVQPSADVVVAAGAATTTTSASETQKATFANVSQPPAAIVGATEPLAESREEVTTGGAEQTNKGADEQIELAPQSLTLTDKEIELMKELAALIGRSPRAVKRFLNCYRLIRVGLNPAQLEAFLGGDREAGQFEAVMILLGIITGAPSVALYFIQELEKYSSSMKSINLNAFLVDLEKNPEVVKQADWVRVRNFLESHIGSNEARTTLVSLIRVTPRVSRYSFRVARTGVGQRRTAPAKPAKVATISK